MVDGYQIVNKRDQKRFYYSPFWGKVVVHKSDRIFDLAINVETVSITRILGIPSHMSVTVNAYSDIPRVAWLLKDSDRRDRINH